MDRESHSLVFHWGMTYRAWEGSREERSVLDGELWPSWIRTDSALSVSSSAF